MGKNINKWTFLIYANGHNELEPEIWQSVLDIQNNSIGKQVNVVVQVSREEQSIVKLLRPNVCVSNADKWSGVRRYVFSDDKNNIVHEIENINMAAPNCLYDFIIWGVTNYPAQRYMLSISGHIYQFVGICPDYSGDKPYMMGFPEISSCIQNACNQLNMNIDIFILDTCYASTIEILYEFGRFENIRIKNIFTYIGEGPLSGFPYDNVLSILDGVVSLETTEILKSMVNNIDVKKHYGLIGFKLDYEVLQIIRQLFSKLAFTYLSSKEFYKKDFTPRELLSIYHSDYPWSLLLKPIHQLLKLLIITKRCADNSNSGVLPIHILYQKIPDAQRKNLYSRLSFSKQNYWTALLCDIPYEQLSNNSSDELNPLLITKNILTAFIYAGNEHLSILEHKEIVQSLIEKKCWEL